MRILVTGATGLIGRALVENLQSQGIKVSAVSRNPAGAGLAKDVEVVGGDLLDPASLLDAMSGVDRMYVYAGAPIAAGLAGAAAQAGVERLVVVSGLDFDPVVVERHLVDAGVGWTHLRPNAFAVNALRHWGATIRSQNLVRSPYPEAATVPIHEADIADVAATTLVEDGHDGRRYELTGPAPLTIRQQVRIISEVLGRDITFIEETPEQARARLLAHTHEGPAVVDRILQTWKSAEGRTLTASPNVAKLTGHPARSFAQWVRDHEGDFAPEADSTTTEPTAEGDNS